MEVKVDESVRKDVGDRNSKQDLQLAGLAKAS